MVEEPSLLFTLPCNSQPYMPKMLQHFCLSHVHNRHRQVALQSENQFLKPHNWYQNLHPCSHKRWQLWALQGI